MTTAKRALACLASALLVLSVAGVRADDRADDAATPVVAPAELERRLETRDTDLVVLDVRTPEEYSNGHVPGARNVPHDRIEAALPALEFARDKDVVVYCRSGKRAAVAIAALEKAGFTRIKHLEGDMLGWQAAQLPVQASVPRAVMPTDPLPPEEAASPPPH